MAPGRGKLGSGGTRALPRLSVTLYRTCHPHALPGDSVKDVPLRLHKFNTKRPGAGLWSPAPALWDGGTQPLVLNCFCKVSVCT